MRRSPRNVQIAFNHAGLTHYGGAFFLHEFLRVLQIRNFIARHLHWSRRNHDYSLSQMVLALAWPLILGLDRIETASLLRGNGTFQFLTGLQSFPDPQTLRRFLLHAPPSFATELRRVNDRLLQFLTHLPNHRSRLILDLDSTVITSFGHQEGASVGYNPRYRGKRSYQPLLCVEAGSAHLLAASLRPGKTDLHSGTVELFHNCWSNLSADVLSAQQKEEAKLTLDSDLKTAEGINAFLAKLLVNLAEDRISPRRAAVMAYTCNLLLRTLPAIEYELNGNAEDEPRGLIVDFPPLDRNISPPRPT
jgi:hypothetical protein